MEPHLYYEQYLFLAALEYANSRNYYFGPDCEHDFRLELKKAVDHMFRADPAFSQDMLDQAKANTIALVQGMIAEINEENKLKRLRESSLKKALDKLCPLFPFCKEARS